MIELEDIKMDFRLDNSTVQILKGISFVINKGEFVSIMGPSGSGKSTLSSILGCLNTPTAGNYKLDGEDVGSLSSRDLAKLRNRKIGFIFQDFNLLEGLSALENVALPLFYAGIPSKERRQRALESLVKVGLGERLHHMPNQLSGGQKQRVAIARALVNEPAFLFADEPTGALDKKTGQEIMGLMQKLNFMGHTVVQVTHSPVDSGFSKRIIHLVDGQIVKDELVDRPAIGSIVQETGQEQTQGRMWRVLQTLPAISSNYEKVVTRLSEVSTDPNSMVEAARALIKYETSDPHGIWSKLFKNENWGVRAEVLKVLWGKPAELTLPYGLEGLKDTNAWVRFLAATLLKRTAPFPLTPKIKRLAGEAIEDSDERVRATVVTWLGLWNDHDALPLLEKTAKDADGRVRANTVDALILLKKTGSDVPLFREVARSHVSDRNNRTRANAAILLFDFSPKQALEVLVSMLHSENNLMRASSAWACGVVGDERSAELLSEMLKSENEELVLSQVIRSLAKLDAKYQLLGRLVKKM